METLIPGSPDTKITFLPLIMVTSSNLYIPIAPILYCNKTGVKKMSWNVTYRCNICGAKGQMFEGVRDFEIKDKDEMPCGHTAENGEFQSFFS